VFETIAAVVLGVVFAVCATWVAQHVLGTAIGRIRAFVTVAIVYALTVPIVQAALQAGDVMHDGELEVSSPMGTIFLALALGWQFAISVTVIMLSELFWPSGRGWHPIRAVQDLLRRRKRLARYTQVVRIASKHGLSLYGSHRHGGDENVPDALVAAMKEAGVTFVKVGQVLSTRDDILPREFTDAFATLQMQTDPLPWEVVRAAIEAELPGTIEEAFAWIDEIPLAAASVAQVHAAILRDDDGEGPKVVVKVQRPDARASVETDSDIILRLAAQAERRAAWARAYGLYALASEFVGSLREELDYRIELANTELLRDSIARSGDGSLHVPQVYPQFCTRRMMVQEHVVGVPFANLDGRLPEAMTETSIEHTRVREFTIGGLDASVEHTAVRPVPTAAEIADTLVDAIFEQVAVRGVFHADLHPGNVILRPDGDLTLIDFGAIGIVERSTRRLMIAMMSAMGAEDDVALTDLLLMISTLPDDSAAERASLQRDLGIILTRMRNGKTGAAVFTEVIEVLRHHQLSLPPALMLVFRTIGSLEGTLRHLVPDYDMVERALARTPHFVGQTLEPKQLLAEARVRAQIAGEQLRRLPRRLETIGSQLEAGTFGVNLRMFRDVRERGWIASLLGQLTTTLIGVALVIAAVMLVVTGGGPQLTPDVGLLPFLGAVLGLCGMLLLLRALRTSLTRRGREDL